MSTKLSNGGQPGANTNAGMNTTNNNSANDSPDVQVTVKDLPISFKVSVAKNLPPNRILPFCNLTVSLDGVKIESITSKLTSVSNFTIDTISYGVQDLVYTRVFAMIVVKENYNLKDKNPFDVHAFVCDSRAMARKLTFALAASFQDYSKRVKEAEEENGGSGVDSEKSLRKKFAIDLRTPEEMQQDITEQETEA
ncbi:AGAP005585-PB-like protein [Anopheles sinensis]|uniref:AGAP005585-PB-like protein n=1 Tax=Anopheles sinensis TaxID=74873 RepID=A0A084W127_ANOSI|nr:AGAP005585-PB-like protein [Anopheles sinensis]